ncbi:MAG: MOSC domain-containing protein [Actinobacteria bacterium]|nr:MOSC domain-containing protein [Actinomycetota bacterium]
MPMVARFNVTPVKATALQHPERLRFERYGVPGNREFLFVDETGRHIGGNKAGILQQIRSAFDAERDELSLTFPDGTVATGPAAGGEPIEARFSRRSVAARLVEGPWTEPLAKHAGRPLRLVRVQHPGEANDVRPVTLVSLESVEELSRRGEREHPVDAGRFRMTIEIEGVSEPHEEDSWEGTHVRIGEAVLRLEGAVPRCVVTTLDPETGLRDFPTLSVIKHYRGENDDGLPFGVYADVIEPGEARVGDRLEPLA